MNQQRKKVEHLIVIGLLLLCFAAGCAHGKGDVSRAGGVLENEKSEPLPDSADLAGQDQAVSAHVEIGAEEPEDTPEFSDLVSDNSEEADHENDEVDILHSEDESLSDSFVGGDDIDDFFDDAGPLSSDMPLEHAETLVADPLIKFNRAMFAVNDKLYFWCLKPAAEGYMKVTPAVVRTGIKNFFNNLGTPARFVNSALQRKFKGAGSELARFIVNTTVGVAGVWDPAEIYLGLKPSEEDFGQTLGSYNLDNGIYIVLPFLGPSTLRDSAGKVGDFFLNPLFYVRPSELAWGMGAVDVVNDATFSIGNYETVKTTYMDPYVMIRDFYVTHRKKKVAE